MLVLVDKNLFKIKKKDNFVLPDNYLMCYSSVMPSALLFHFRLLLDSKNLRLKFLKKKQCKYLNLISCNYIIYSKSGEIFDKITFKELQVLLKEYKVGFLGFYSRGDYYPLSEDVFNNLDVNFCFFFKNFINKASKSIFVGNFNLFRSLSLKK